MNQRPAPVPGNRQTLTTPTWLAVTNVKNLDPFFFSPLRSLAFLKIFKNSLCQRREPKDVSLEEVDSDVIVDASGRADTWAIDTHLSERFGATCSGHCLNMDNGYDNAIGCRSAL